MFACGAPLGPEAGDAGADAGERDGGDGGDFDSGIFDAGLSDAGNDAGPSDGGHRGGDFCSPCVDRSDCSVSNGLCLGPVGHCGTDCSGGKPCPTGASCQPIGSGKVIIGHQCVPTVAACGDLSGQPALDCKDTWDNYANAFFGTHCRSCHRHDFAFKTAADVRNGAEGIRTVIDLKQMPSGESLSDPERRRVLTWLACGAN